MTIAIRRLAPSIDQQRVAGPHRWLDAVAVEAGWNPAVGGVAGRYRRPMLPTEALLEISSTWPEMALTPGAVLFDEGGDDGRLAVLVEGSLSVRRGDEEF